MALRGLPNFIYLLHPEDDRTIIVRWGYVGYWSAGSLTKEWVENWLKEHGFDREDVLALLAGSMYGWNIPMVSDRFLPPTNTPSIPEQQYNDNARARLLANIDQRRAAALGNPE
jgi:hypothetical protein